MSGVTHVAIEPRDAGMRLDRWFRREFPRLGHGHLAKLLRTGRIRLDGGRCKPGARLEPGQTLRLPPLSREDALPAAPPASSPASWTPSTGDIAELAASVLYRDDHVMAVDKPSGLAVQGGTATARHLDAMLDGLRFGGAERPRLVHRLDRDTSGVLLLARTAPAARSLAESFRSRSVDKLYWALVAGRPAPRRGHIALALAKRGPAGAERARPVAAVGRPARTSYRVIDAAGRRASWLELRPLTGRTHQLRAHCAAIGHPILGDRKHGGRDAFLPGAGLAARLHLHARSIRLPHPGGGTLEVEAPLAPDLRRSWARLGFDWREAG